MTSRWPGAGLYDVWQRPDGEDLYPFTILTTEADPFMARLHNRMPVILARALEEAWLDPALTQAHDVLDVLSRRTGLGLEASPMSRMGNRPHVERQGLLQRVQ